MSIDLHWLVLLAAAAGTIGTVGGLGGAILFVPVLVLAGTDPALAAPLGLVSVAAGAVAAGPIQLGRGVVHHRLGLTVEISASVGALLAAVWSAQASPAALRYLLAATAFVAGVMGLTRTELRNRPTPEFVAEPPAEWPGTLSGTYLGPGGAIPYRARRLPLGVGCMFAAGAVSGLAGVGGGFIKTPIMREIMWVPVKVAAATSTFTVGITSATALIVFAGQGRLQVEPGAAVALGGLAGGLAGAWIQDRLSPTVVRRLLGLVLLVVAVLVAVDP
ncbi:MAG: sulfite exporter TauE/SafE family protein [Acidimicrobiales bacterium]